MMDSHDQTERHRLAGNGMRLTPAHVNHRLFYDVDPDAFHVHRKRRSKHPVAVYTPKELVSAFIAARLTGEQHCHFVLRAWDQNTDTLAAQVWTETIDGPLHRQTSLPWWLDQAWRRYRVPTWQDFANEYRDDVPPVRRIVIDEHTEIQGDVNLANIFFGPNCLDRMKTA